MIELVFVIVIIGILAAVAIPRLATNRDDAEAIVVVNNLKDLVNETIASYTATGKLTKDPWQEICIVQIAPEINLA